MNSILPPSSRPTYEDNGFEGAASCWFDEEDDGELEKFSDCFDEEGVEKVCDDLELPDGLEELEEEEVVEVLEGLGDELEFGEEGGDEEEFPEDWSLRGGATILRYKLV